MDIEKVRKNMKNKKKSSHLNIVKCNKTISKILITILITLICLITLKTNTNLKQKFYHYVYEDNIKFVYFKSLYNKYFGDILPVKDKIEPVFNEKIKYDNISKYEDGFKLKVTNNYLIPALESGMVVYIGSKDKLNNTVIVQQINGVDVWYGNINTVSVKLYDYIEKGSLIGEAKDDNLYLVFKKDGAILSYEDYL